MLALVLISLIVIGLTTLYFLMNKIVNITSKEFKEKNKQ